MKAHLVSGFDGPLKDGKTYHAICGKTVEHSVIKFFFDSDFRSLTEALRKNRNVCVNCIAARVFLSDGLVYGVISAKKRLRGQGSVARSQLAAAQMDAGRHSLT